MADPTKVVIQTPGGPMEIPAELISQPLQIAEYKAAQRDWRTHYADERAQMAVLDGSLASHSFAPIHAPTPVKLPEPGLDVQVQAQQWMTRGGLTIGALPTALWPPQRGMDAVSVVNTGANDLVLAPSEAILRSGAGITLAAGAAFRINVQAGGWGMSLAGTTVDVAWTHYVLGERL